MLRVGEIVYNGMVKSEKGCKSAGKKSNWAEIL